VDRTHRLALARPAGRIWTLEQRVPALCPPVAGGRVATGVRCAAQGTTISRSVHRLDHRSRPPARRWCPQKNGAQALGRSRGGLTTKIHVVVDAIGRLIQGRLTAGHVHDVTQAQPLPQAAPARCVAADKAHDATALPPDDRRGWSQGGHPAARQPAREDSMEQGDLSSSQSRRAFLLQPQALPPHRHALRQTGRTLRIVRLHRRRCRVHAVNVNTP